MAKKLKGLSFEQATEAALLMLEAVSRTTAVRTSKLAKFMAGNGAVGKSKDIAAQLVTATKSRWGMTLGRYVGGAVPGSLDNYEWANLRNPQ